MGSSNVANRLAENLEFKHLLHTLDHRYIMVPGREIIHKELDRVLGVDRGGSWFMDTALPFGLRSAPKIFTPMADGLLWIMAANGVGSTHHYLDDFLILAPLILSTGAASSSTSHPAPSR